MSNTNKNKRIKVVWLCNFANEEINQYFRTSVGELSPWVSGLIRLFENNQDIDIHIVAPNLFTNRNESFVKAGINYHLYQYRSRIIPRSAYNRFRLDFRTNFIGIKQRVKKIIGRIQPDLIHLIGAEIPYYSASILPLFSKYKALVSIQGFVRHASNTGYVHKKRVKIEEQIIKKASFIGIQAEFMTKVIKSINPFAQIIKHDYPNTEPDIIKPKNGKEEYDFVFFARVIRDKGIEDLLNALSNLKIKKGDVSLLIIGKVQKPYMEYLLKQIAELNIEENVHFTGFLKTQHDVYNEAIKAKICVLPTYHDIIPGTLVESVYMKLPAIAYNVGGVPDMNLINESIVLVEKHNIKVLTEKMWRLLNDEEKRNELVEIAYKTIKEQYGNDKIPVDYLQMYKSILTKHV